MTDQATNAGGKLEIESFLSTVIIKIHCPDEVQADALMDRLASQYLDEGKMVLECQKP